MLLGWLPSFVVLDGMTGLVWKTYNGGTREPLLFYVFPMKPIIYNSVHIVVYRWCWRNRHGSELGDVALQDTLQAKNLVRVNTIWLLRSGKTWSTLLKVELMLYGLILSGLNAELLLLLRYCLLQKVQEAGQSAQLLDVRLVVGLGGCNFNYTFLQSNTVCYESSSKPMIDDST